MTTAAAVAGAAQLAGLALAPLAAGNRPARQGTPAGPPRTVARSSPIASCGACRARAPSQPELATVVYRLAPAVVAASVAIAALLVPIGGEAPDWGLGHDALVVVGLLALGRFAITIAAWDTGSGFALMGAGRDLTFAVFAEGVLLLVVLLTALPAGGSTDLEVMSAAAAGVDIWSEPLHWCAALAFAARRRSTEAGRQPVDNPDTHLELTMVHEGPLLEYAGRDLAMPTVGRRGAPVADAACSRSSCSRPSPDRSRRGSRSSPARRSCSCVALALTETAFAKMRDPARPAVPGRRRGAVPRRPGQLARRRRRVTARVDVGL